jgi:oligopeptide transport system permease protein
MRLIKYILKRLVWMVITLALILTLVFIITRTSMILIWMPRQPFMDALMSAITQYVSYLEGVVTRWDWGLSRHGKDVWELFFTKLPFSMNINLIAFAIYLPIGVLLGTIAAVKKNSWFDNVISFLTMIFSSIPSFILIFAFIMVFGYVLKWWPPQSPSVLADGALKWKGLAIPVLVLSFQPIATLTRALRGELVETLNSDHLLLARAKGLNFRQLLFRHTFRNSLVPVIQLIPATFITVLTNSFFVEIVYGIPGLAGLFLDSIYQPMMDTGYFFIDTNTIMPISAFYAAIGLVAALVVDVAYVFIDPTMKIGSKRTHTNQ